MSRAKKVSDRRLGAFDLDGYSVGVVADAAAKGILRGQAIDERAEADALHHSANAHRLANSPGCGRRVQCGLAVDG